MPLSDAERAALRGRAQSLRAEVSSLTDERDKNVQDAATERRDAKLLAEVVGLEQQRDSAAESRDRAAGSVEDAAALMEAAARQASVVSDTDPTGSSPALPAKTDEPVVDKAPKESKSAPKAVVVEPVIVGAEGSK
jgi:hypothetical protein